jgi:hypothetical protein
MQGILVIHVVLRDRRKLRMMSGTLVVRVNLISFLRLDAQDPPPQINRLLGGGDGVIFLAVEK